MVPKVVNNCQRERRSRSRRQETRARRGNNFRLSGWRGVGAQRHPIAKQPAPRNASTLRVSTKTIPSTPGIKPDSEDDCGPPDPPLIEKRARLRIQRGIAMPQLLASTAQYWHLALIDEGEHRFTAWSGFCNLELRKSNSNFLWNTFDEDGKRRNHRKAKPPSVESCEGRGCPDIPSC